MKKQKKTLMLSGIALAVVGIIAAGYLIFQLMPAKSISAFADTFDSQPQEDAIAVYDKGISEAAEKQADTHAPVISKKDATVNEGTKVNILENVSAKDEVDGDLTSKIKTEGTVDSSKAGTYTIKLTVTDKSGNTATANKKVTVKAAEKVEAAYSEASSSATAAQDSSSSAAASSSASSTAESTAPAASSSTQSAAANSTSSGSGSTATQTTGGGSTASGYSAMTMYIGGAAIPYQNGGQGSGQSIIDSNPYGTVSTWGGAAAQSGSDGMNTHFIGHNPGIFSSIMGLGSGSQVVVTDGNGTATTYTVSTVLNVDDSAHANGKNYWSLITGTGGGERVTLQTCINDSTNRIVIAYA